MGRGMKVGTGRKEEKLEYHRGRSPSDKWWPLVAPWDFRDGMGL